MSWALIAGGSKGIGYHIAEALGSRGFHLLLVARDREQLGSARNKLISQFAVRVDILPIDLAEPGAAEEIRAWCTGRALDLNVLCCVAGFGGARDFPDLPAADLHKMICVNLESPAMLCQAMMPILEKHAPAFVLTTGSLAAFAPLSVKSMYSASKSGLLFFTYALRQQWKEKNISASCLCPGPVFTRPDIEQETRRKMGWWGNRMAVPPRSVGELAVHGLLRGKMLIIPGKLATLSSYMLRLMPASWLARWSAVK